MCQTFANLGWSCVWKNDTCTQEMLPCKELIQGSQDAKCLTSTLMISDEVSQTNDLKRDVDKFRSAKATCNWSNERCQFRSDPFVLAEPTNSIAKFLKWRILKSLEVPWLRSFSYPSSFTKLRDFLPGSPSVAAAWPAMWVSGVQLQAAGWTRHETGGFFQQRPDMALSFQIKELESLWGWGLGYAAYAYTLSLIWRCLCIPPHAFMSTGSKMRQNCWCKEVWEVLLLMLVSVLHSKLWTRSQTHTLVMFAATLFDQRISCESFQCLVASRENRWTRSWRHPWHRKVRGAPSTPSSFKKNRKPTASTCFAIQKTWRLCFSRLPALSYHCCGIHLSFIDRNNMHKQTNRANRKVVNHNLT